MCDIPLNPILSRQRCAQKFFFSFISGKLSGSKWPASAKCARFLSSFFFVFFLKSAKIWKKQFISKVKNTLGYLQFWDVKKYYFLAAFKENSVREFFFSNTNYSKEENARFMWVSKVRRLVDRTLNWIIVKFKRLKINYNKLCVLSDLNEWIQNSMRSWR